MDGNEEKGAAMGRKEEARKGGRGQDARAKN